MDIVLGNGQKVSLFQGQYGNKRAALFAKTLNGEPYAVLSVNVVDALLASNEMAFPMYKLASIDPIGPLQMAGIIIGDMLYEISSGFFKIPVYRVNLNDVPYGGW